MSKTELKQNFLNKMELFYRNFGNEWSLEDFVSNDSQKKYLAKFLVELENKGIVTINKEGKSFIILDLPSNYDNLLI